MKKKIIIIICVLIFVAGGTFAGFKLFNKKESVEVVSVRDIELGWMPGQTYMGGMVNTDVYQDVYMSSSLDVTEICVQPGDTVKPGDVLIKYDATMAGIEVQLKKLSIQQNELDIESYKKELKKLSKYKVSASYNAGKGKYTLLSNSEEKEVIVIDETALYVSGSGTAEEPYIFKCIQGSRVSSRFISMLQAMRTEREADIYAILEFAESEEKDYIYALNIVVTADAFDFSVYIRETEPVVPTPSESVEPTPTPSESIEPTPSPSPSESVEPTPSESDVPVPSESFEPVIPDGPTYTKEEIAQMKAELNQKINDAELENKKLELEIKKSEAENLSEKIANINGTVTVVNEPEGITDGEVLIHISGGSGFYINSSIDEYSLEKLNIGTELTVRTYGMEMMDYNGKVVEIGDMPISTNGNMGSTYSVKIYVDADDLRMGDYVDIVLDGEDYMDTESMALYLFGGYINTDNDGNRYVMKAVNGVLKKQIIKTGKMFSNYYEILSGVTKDDYLAFPYGRNAKENAPAKMPEDSFEGESTVDVAIEEPVMLG